LRTSPSSDGRSLSLDDLRFLAVGFDRYLLGQHLAEESLKGLRLGRAAAPIVHPAGPEPMLLRRLPIAPLVVAMVGDAFENVNLVVIKTRLSRGFRWLA
jgi:hypothetical protein